MRKRNIRVPLRLSKEEKQHLDKLVKKSGLKRETFIRQILKGYILKEKPSEDFFYIMKEFSSIGNSLNQLAAKAHTLGFIDTPLIRQHLRSLIKLELEVREKFLLPERNK